MLEVGKSRTLRWGSARRTNAADDADDTRGDDADVAILAFGNMVATALDAAVLLADRGADARVVDMRWAKPLDEEAIALAARTKLIVTLEDGILSGGAGEGVLGTLSKLGLSADVLTLGIDNRFVPHGKQALLLADLGLDANGVAAAVMGRLAN